MSNTSIIVLANMSSTRLPIKVLKRIAGMPILAHQVERKRPVIKVPPASSSPRPPKLLMSPMGTFAKRGRSTMFVLLNKKPFLAARKQRNILQ